METSAYEFRAEILKAMAHPGRLRIIEALAQGEKCVCELQEVVGSALPTVSRHLARMKSAGIVDCRREGNQIFYHLLVPCLLDVFACLDEVLRHECRRRAEACQWA